MTQIKRRSFLKTSAAAGATLAFAPHARPQGANGDLRVAVVGFRAQGNVHLRNLRELAGVRVVALCDADRNVLNRGVKAFADRDLATELAGIVGKQVSTFPGSVESHFVNQPRADALLTREYRKPFVVPGESEI